MLTPEKCAKRILTAKFTIQQGQALPLFLNIYDSHAVACHKLGLSIRIDDTFRIKQVQQIFLGFHEFYTTLSLTDDGENTFAKKPADLISAYHNVMFTDPEAQLLKATGIDPLVPRLSQDYP